MCQKGVRYIDILEKPVQLGFILKSSAKSKGKEKKSISNSTVNFLAILDLAVGTLLPKFDQVIQEYDAANTDTGLCQLKLLVEGRSRYKICRYNYKPDRDQVKSRF